MAVNLIIEPGYSSSNRLKRTMDGINSVATQKHLSVHTAQSFEELVKNCPYSKVTLILSASTMWTIEAISRLSLFDMHPILIGFQFLDTIIPYSCVTQDYKSAAYNLTKFLILPDTKKIAFLGMNFDSLPDTMKYNGFLQAINESNVESETYTYTGSIVNCIESFKENIEQYQSILCSNDIVATVLLSAIDHPEKYNIAGFGNMQVGKFTTPALTTISLDYYTAGKIATDLYLYLSDKSSVISSTITIESKVEIRNSVNNRSILSQQAKQKILPNKKIEFYSNTTVIEVEKIDKMLSECDPVDIEILHLCLLNKTYENIAEHQNLSVNSVKYRIRKMNAATGTLSKNDLIKLLQKYKMNF